MNFSDRYNELVSNTQDLSKYSIDELVQILEEAKKTQSIYDNMQLVVKCDGNSLYGVSASIYFSLNDFDIAEDITMTGKFFAVSVDRNINKFFVNWGDNESLIIQKFYPQVTSIRKFTEYVPDTINDLCVYGDTDSRYIDLSRIYSLLLLNNGESLKLPESNKELADFACFLMDNFISQIIKDTIDNESDFRNMKKGHLKMNHEITTRRCIFQKKKKYIMTAIWTDGKLLDKPKLKFKGVELKKGSMAPKMKKILSKLVDKYLLENYTIPMLRLECLKLIKYIKSKKEKDFIYSISSVSGLKDICKDSNGVYTSDKNHIQMQIALSWMNFIEVNKLHNDYRPPFEGQKMNFYYCAEGSGYKVIGVPDDVDINKVKGLPEPDWNQMINMIFLKPLLRYIYDKDLIDDMDIEHFILGVKQWKF